MRHLAVFLDPQHLKHEGFWGITVLCGETNESQHYKKIISHWIISYLSTLQQFSPSYYVMSLCQRK